MKKEIVCIGIVVMMLGLTGCVANGDIDTSIKTKTGILNGVYTDSKTETPSSKNTVTITFEDDTYLEIWKGDYTGLFYFAKNHIDDEITVQYSRIPEGEMFSGHYKIHSWEVNQK